MAVAAIREIAIKDIAIRETAIKEIAIRGVAFKDIAIKKLPPDQSQRQDKKEKHTRKNLPLMFNLIIHS